MHRTEQSGARTPYNYVPYLIKFITVKNDIEK